MELDDRCQTDLRELRRAYWHSFLEGMGICWPVLSSILARQATLGALIGLIEGWGAGPGVYFAFITGLTVGYGDLVPTRFLGRVLAVLIGFCGIALTGLVAAIAVKAFQVAPRR